MINTTENGQNASDWITVAQAAREVPFTRDAAVSGDNTPAVDRKPVSPRGVHIATIHRWRSRGVRLPNHTVVYLKMTRFPGRWLTRRSWLVEFLDHVNRAYSPMPPSGARLRTPEARRRASNQASKRLARMGI
jgi:hypothetical protein